MKLAFLISGIFICAVHAFGSNEARWNLNDVSYLFDIPHSNDETLDHLLAPMNSGKKGSLLPQWIYNKIPTLLNAGNGNPTLYDGPLRVIALRVDPCPANFDNKCAPEMRVVWQPIEIDFYQNRWLARDGAVHSFYRLTDSEFDKLKQELWDLKIYNEKFAVNTDRLPLNVHPAIKNPNTADHFYKTVRNILLKYCGEKNLTKVTFMSLLTPTQWWRFGSFVPNAQGEWAMEEIPRIEATTEDIFNTGIEQGSKSGPGRAMDAIFNVLPESYPQEDDISAIINNGYRQNNENDYPVFANKLDAAARFRNPLITNPKTLDCASCHYADAAKFYSAERFPTLNQFASRYDYNNPDPKLYNLDNVTIAKEATRVVRAFGFFDTEPAINQRTINDSAESAHFLNSRK